MAYLDQLNTSFKNTGLQVLAVNENKPKIVNQVGSYIRKRKYKFNTAIDPLGKLADKLNIKTLPTTILADKNGNIIYRSVGYKDGMENEYLSELIKYLDQENIEYDDFKFEDKSARRKKAILDVEF
ncbi:TlpA family protein disulfide reductase [bacterium]|nr:TlpA family protein disulfide reductase [Candidatus Neomarinimicrobiota bacterium]MDC0645815.1 TlpA family protein disulfide reductase [bacterium]MDC1037532.1 TlpA disulfide reductase family protein [Candidatus Neomarinimicrobiota bacterium]